MCVQNHANFAGQADAVTAIEGYSLASTNDLHALAPTVQRPSTARADPRLLLGLRQGATFVLKM